MAIWWVDSWRTKRIEVLQKIECSKGKLGLWCRWWDLATALWVLGWRALIQEARKVFGRGFHCCVLELKISGSGVKNAARSFSFVYREGFNKEGMYRKEAANAQRPTATFRRPTALSCLLLCVRSTVYKPFFIVFWAAHSVMGGFYLWTAYGLVLQCTSYLIVNI